MADEPRKSLSELIRELIDAISKVQESPAREELLEALSGLAQSAEKDPNKTAAAIARTAITQRQKEAAVSGKVNSEEAHIWFQKRWPSPRPCPVCKVDDWGLNPAFSHLSIGPLGGNFEPEPYLLSV